MDIVTGNAGSSAGRSTAVGQPCPDRRAAPTLQRMLKDETAIFTCRSSAPCVYSSGFDESCARTRTTTSGFGGDRGSRFWRNDEPRVVRRRDDSLSPATADDSWHHPRLSEERPTLSGTQPSRVLDAHSPALRRPYRRRARTAIESGDFDAASDRLAALPAGAADGTRIARGMARWTPALLAKAYGIRARAWRTIRPARVGRVSEMKYSIVIATTSAPRTCGDAQSLAGCSPTVRGNHRRRHNSPDDKARSSRKRPAHFPSSSDICSSVSRAAARP